MGTQNAVREEGATSDSCSWGVWRGVWATVQRHSKVLMESQPSTHAEDSIHAFLLLLISEAFAAMVQLFSVILHARHEESFISLFYSMLSD